MIENVSGTLILGDMMKRDVVIFNGLKFRRMNKGRYFNSDSKTLPERLLHRYTWFVAYGPIPPGYHVHHKDGNSQNNALSNLELMPGSEHSRKHRTERNNADPAAWQAALELAREQAKKWHASEEGLRWHSENGKRSWMNRKPDKCKCERCGSDFFGFNNARFCSRACEMAVAYRRYFDTKRQCLHCGVEFIANRHRKTQCCSRLCGNRRRGQMQRIANQSKAV